MRCAIWYHLCHLKNVKNTHGGVLLLVLKVTLHHVRFSRFLNCANCSDWRKASHISQQLDPFLSSSNTKEESYYVRVFGTSS